MSVSWEKIGCTPIAGRAKIVCPPATGDVNALDVVVQQGRPDPVIAARRALALEGDELGRRRSLEEAVHEAVAADGGVGLPGAGVGDVERLGLEERAHNQKVPLSVCNAWA